MMTSSNGNIFRVTGLLCKEFTGYRWIPHTNDSDAQLWYCIWSAPEWTVELTIVKLMILDAITLAMCYANTLCIDIYKIKMHFIISVLDIKFQFDWLLVRKHGYGHWWKPTMLIRNVPVATLAPLLIWIWNVIITTRSLHFVSKHRSICT